MSEELLQMVPQQIGKHTYYRLGSTTLGQLMSSGIIPKKDYGTILRKKPDGLVVYHRHIVAVVEYKTPQELGTDLRVNKAIKQELDVARALCKILIVTDSTKTYWVNALNGKRVRDAHGNELRTVFHPLFVKNQATVEYLLDEVAASLTAQNSTIRSAKLVDPTPLAARLWQTIWVATGKAPVKCLYNVVELFIFKFLSDLGILPDDIAFTAIFNKSRTDPEDALDFYAKNTRKRIYKLFPVGADGTTIINGTIFVAEDGDANLSQAILFRRSLEHLYKYGEEFGSLTKIDKQFKTKLYESFLQQEVEALGQYFTPRRVVQSVIRMGGLNTPSFQFSGKRLCDPFCGVGGFPLELLNMNEGMSACYRPDAGGHILLPFALHGFDKGFERDDERTVILAKANMLVYLAEILFTNPNCSKEFARVFNDTFKLFKDNLGTFGHIIEDENEKYDVIISNPPYVTSGTDIIKEEIRRTARTQNAYPVNALGLESLSLEWIVRSLRKGGRAFVIIPDGILARVGGKKLRDHILRECYLDAIVSLPVRTFFPNFEHTYILAITKKHSPDDAQTAPVFTYLVSHIGERLTSIRREDIDADDLPEMENLFRIFAAARADAKPILEQQSNRCKIQDIQRFQNEPHWLINRWWTVQERTEIGALDSPEAAAKDEVDARMNAFREALADYDAFVSAKPLRERATVEIGLGDTKIFNLFLGKRVLRKDVNEVGTTIPVYSANVFEPMGTIQHSNVKNFGVDSILWGIDGNFEFNRIPAGTVFATTDHCGTLQILDKTIDPVYLLSALYHRREEESFDRSFRASLANMRRLTVVVPVKPDGTFDQQAQREIAERFTKEAEKLATLRAEKIKLDAIVGRYIATACVL